MAYFHCLIGGGSSGGGYELTVTCDADFAGKTITCTDGVTTLTQTCPSASPYEVVFEIPNGGDWTISGVVGGHTVSTGVNIPTSASLIATVQQTVTIYSAKEDTISYTDIDGATQTITFASGETSKQVTITINPNGSSITFTSSVAKNPDNLSQDYSKTFTITTSTTELYLMPENTLYWWGYNSATNPIIALNSSDGWDITSSGYTFNKNNVSASGTQGYAAVGATDKISSTKFHGIGFGNGYWGPNNLIILKGKQIKTSATWSKYTSFNTTISHVEVVPDDNDEYNFATSYGGTSQAWNWTIYALWYE